MLKFRWLYPGSLVLLFAYLGCSERFFLSPDLPSREFVSLYSSSTMQLVNESYAEHIKGDDLPRSSLLQAIDQSLVYFDKISPNEVFDYGKLEYTTEEVIASLHLFKRLLSRQNDYDQLIADLEENFFLFESAANADKQVLMTGYYEPLFEGSLTKSDKYNVPVYSLPKDLLVLQLENFRKSLKNRTIVYRLENNRIFPYYSRKQIMEDRILEGRNIEIAWMKDPIDLFFLQIQGSGTLILPSGELVKLSYAGSNGHPYSSIGKLLVDENKMKLEEVSMESIRKYISDHHKEKKRILYYNNSYTFLNLHRSDENPKGSLNVPLTPLRSIATDSTIFPKGSIGYVNSEMPEFDKSWNVKGLKPFSRFVVNQDTGGAIRGPGRVDVFWGNGKLAEKSAGFMRSFGKLYFLVAKKEAIKRLIPDRI